MYLLRVQSLQDSNDFHQVTYLPMIADSPKKNSAIYEMLIQQNRKQNCCTLVKQIWYVIMLYI